MEEEQIEIPDFMQEYYSGSDEEGQVVLQNLASSYKKQRQEYMMNTHANQTAIHKALYGGAAKKIDPEAGFAWVKDEFKARAEKIALGSGYVKPQGQPTPEVKPEKQVFLEKMRTMRQSATANDIRAANVPTASSGGIPPKDMALREKFLDNMKSIRQQQTLVHTPKG